jgi:hypothetical protein
LETGVICKFVVHIKGIATHFRVDFYISHLSIGQMRRCWQSIPIDATINYREI